MFYFYFLRKKVVYQLNKSFSFNKYFGLLKNIDSQNLAQILYYIL